MKALLPTLLLITCLISGCRHTESENSLDTAASEAEGRPTQAPTTDPSSAIGYPEEYVAEATNVGASLDGAIVQLEAGNKDAAVERIETAIYSIAAEKVYSTGPARDELNKTVLTLGSMAHLIADNKLTDKEELRSALAWVRLDQARSLLTVQLADPGALSEAINNRVPLSGLPLLAPMVTQLRSASHYFTGKQKAEVDALIARTTSALDKDYDAKEAGEAALKDIAIRLESFFTQHAAEFSSMNADLASRARLAGAAYSQRMKLLQGKIDYQTTTGVN